MLCNGGLPSHSKLTRPPSQEAEIFAPLPLPLVEMLRRKDLPRQRPSDPEAIAARASSNGFKKGEHEEKDKERCAKKYSEEVLGKQDRVLHVYAALVP